MFHLTLKPDVYTLFEGFCILKRDETSIQHIYSYPDGYKIENLNFIFPCSCKSERTEEYTIVNTDGSINRSFTVCRFVAKFDLYFCIVSYKPWYEIFSRMLNYISDNFDQTGMSIIGKFLEKNRHVQKDLQILNLQFNDDTVERFLIPSLSYPHIYDSYIKEYIMCNRQQDEYKNSLWLEIYWSLLLERPVIFMSKRFQLITSSLLAAAFFIHPLSWSHKFVSIIPSSLPDLLGSNCCLLGVHSCMKSKLETTQFWDEALLVDLDTGTSKMVGNSQADTVYRFTIHKKIVKFYQTNIPKIDQNQIKDNPDNLDCIVSSKFQKHSESAIMFQKYQRGFHMYPLLFRKITVLILGHYRDYFHNAHKIDFDVDRFVKHIPKLSEFLKLLKSSQCFVNFIDERLNIEPGGFQQENDRFDRERLETNLTTEQRRIFKSKKRTNSRNHSKIPNTLFHKSTNHNKPNSKSMAHRKSSLDHLPSQIDGNYYKDEDHTSNATNKEDIHNGWEMSEAILNDLKDKKIVSRDKKLTDFGYSPQKNNRPKPIRKSKSEGILTSYIEELSENPPKPVKKSIPKAVRTEEVIPGRVKCFVDKYNNITAEATKNQHILSRKNSKQ